MRVFVPVEDAPPSSSIPMLVPYRCGIACAHELREPDDWRPRDFRSFDDRIESKGAERTS